MSHTSSALVHLAAPLAGRVVRPGISLIYTTAVMLVLIGFVSLAVDIGRVQLAHTELRTAADAGAFAGASHLRSDRDTAAAHAQQIASANTCDGTAVQIIPDEDILFGKWRWYSRTFGEASDSTSRVNAMRVNCRRTSDRDNPIGLYFARALGFPSWNVGASATVMLTGGRATLGIVGIDSLTMVGTSETDSYNSTEGPYDPADHYENGDIASNGTIDLLGTVDVDGSAHTGPDGDLDAGSNTTISGDESPFAEDLQYEPVDARPYSNPNNYNNLLIIPGATTKQQVYKSNNGNLEIGVNGSMKDFTLKGTDDPSVPAGTEIVRYYIRDLVVHSGATLTVGNNVELYVTGSISIAGNVQSLSATSTPDDFKILVDGPGTLQITGQGQQNNQFQGIIYAPESNITIGGNTDFYGAVVGKTLTINGTAGIHYDEAIGWEETWPEETHLVD